MCELLCRGEVMQGVMRREKRVVMVEICMVVVVVEPARSRLVGQVRGQIYSWRGQRLDVWHQETAKVGLPWKINLKFDFNWLTSRFKNVLCYDCTITLGLGHKKWLDIENWHCHGECARMSWDTEPNSLGYQFCCFFFFNCQSTWISEIPDFINIRI